MGVQVDDPASNDARQWQLLMEAMVVGALRGMAEGHAQLSRAMGSSVPPLGDLTMYQAAEILAATLLEDSADCEEERNLSQASRQAGRNILGHLKSLREQRRVTGQATLHRIVDQAGLERHRRH